MKLILCSTILFSVLFIGFKSTAQSSNFGNWLIYIGNKQINSKWNWHNEVQYRNYNVLGDLEQLLIRTGVGYNLSDNNNNVLLGYGFVQSENYQPNNELKQTVLEHRIYQQFTTTHKFGRINFQHRYRLEERFIEGRYRTRFRYFFALKVAINHKEMNDNTFYFSAYNELFLQPIKHTYFDRNRLYGGLGFKFNKILRLELGYMNQFFALGQRDQFNVFAYVNF